MILTIKDINGNLAAVDEAEFQKTAFENMSLVLGISLDVISAMRQICLQRGMREPFTVEKLKEEFSQSEYIDYIG